VDWLGYIITAVVGYLLGSIPTGYLVARAKGVDIRTVGSGNIGATNVFRVLGKPAGIFVLAADGLKGWIACGVAASFTLGLFSTQNSSSTPSHELAGIFGGVAAILGHNYTCWLKFKGGKGIATTAGVFVGLAPMAFGVALGVWVVVFAASRYVSVASIAAAVALPAAVWLSGAGIVLKIISTAVGAMAIYKHKANIQRLRAGTENRFGAKKQPDSPPTPS